MDAFRGCRWRGDNNQSLIMKHLYAILAALFLVAPAQSQTLKALAYNTANGLIAYNGTNRLTFEQKIEVQDGLYFNGDLYMVDGSSITADGYLALYGNWTFEGTVGFSFPGIVRTNLGATTIGSAVFTATNATAARQALGLQSYTNTLTNSLNVLEIGSSYTTAQHGWSIQPTNAAFAVRQLEGIDGGANAYILQLTNNIGSVQITFAPITNDRTWTLRVGDGLGITNTVTSTILFQNYMIWGRSTNTTLNNAAIQTLHTTGGGASRAFATSRSRSFTMDGGGQYIFIAYPAGFGSASFTVGGLPNTAFTLTTNSYTNASGYVTNYLIYRTDTIQNGTGINFVVQ